MHPRWLRCSSLKYSRYSQSSRLAIGAPRPSRCDARLSPRALKHFFSAGSAVSALNVICSQSLQPSVCSFEFHHIDRAALAEPVGCRVHLVERVIELPLAGDHLVRVLAQMDEVRQIAEGLGNGGREPGEGASHHPAEEREP